MTFFYWNIAEPRCADVIWAQIRPGPLYSRMGHRSFDKLAWRAILQNTNPLTYSAQRGKGRRRQMLAVKSSYKVK